MQKFKLWSQVSPAAKGALSPDMGLRNWDDLEKEEKRKILKHLAALGWFEDADVIIRIIGKLNDMYRVHTYGTELFEHGGPHRNPSWGYDSCCEEHAAKDLTRILLNQNESVVLELLSLYAQGLIETYHLEKDGEKDIDAAYAVFDDFANGINENFDQFGVSLALTRESFVPKQEPIIQELVIEPVFRKLSDPVWKDVQEEFSTSLEEYRNGTTKGYSNSITHSVSAVQAFLQMRVNGAIGKGDIDDLIRKGINAKKIPNDEFSKKVLNGLKATLMEYRQKQGSAHPKKEYANDKSARFVLGTAALFIQHCMD